MEDEEEKQRLHVILSRQGNLATFAHTYTDT